MTDPHISQKISRFPVPEFNQLPEDIQKMLTEVSDRAEFIPNVFLTLAYRPDELRAFFAYHNALMLRKSGISKAEKEMIIVATSAENSCLYCVIAHGAILRIYAKSGSLSDQIATNYRKADITKRQCAMLDFAVKVCNHSADVAEDDFATLAAHGFSEDDIWDIAGIVSLFALSNRMASVTTMRPNDEFYQMGRGI